MSMDSNEQIHFGVGGIMNQGMPMPDPGVWAAAHTGTQFGTNVHRETLPPDSHMQNVHYATYRYALNNMLVDRLWDSPHFKILGLAGLLIMLAVILRNYQ